MSGAEFGFLLVAVASFACAGFAAYWARLAADKAAFWAKLAADDASAAEGVARALMAQAPAPRKPGRPRKAKAPAPAPAPASLELVAGGPKS